MQLRSRPIGRNGKQELLSKIDTTASTPNLPEVVVESNSFVSRKTMALILLVLQNASVSLLTRLSRTPRPGQLPYAPAVAVFVAELMKVSLSMTMLIGEKRALRRKGKDKPKGYLATAGDAVTNLFRNQREEIVKLAVPAALYATQNTLLYTALTNLDAATYQTTYQLKLLTAAFFSILFFKRSLSNTKWFALFLLTVGVAIVQLDGVKSPSSKKPDQGLTNPRVGLAAILAACISSGLAGGWFEYVLKSPTPAPPPSQPSSPVVKSPNSPSLSTPPSSASSTSSSVKLQLRKNSPSLWERNLQLSVPSLIFSGAGVLLSRDWQGNILQGFTPLVWSVVLNQAMGGLLVALVVREADGVAKGFATSIAIVLSTLASIVFFGLLPGPMFVGGAFLVIASTIIYAADG